jgi:TRAP-type uncharacterized transport system substrate-binding protein
VTFNVPVPIANGRIGSDDGLRYRPPMETIAPPRSLRGRWWDTVVGAGPLVVGLLIAFVALGLYVAYRVLDPTPDKRIVIATGPEEGAYIEFAKRYQPLLRAHGLAVELRTTQGSSENLALLRDPQSGVDAAFVQGGVDTVDTGEHRTVASLGSVAYEPVWLFCREAAARELRDNARLNNLSQLAGWRINTGPSGGGAGPLFRQLAQANHIEATQLQLGEKPAVHAVVDLLQGRTDAVLMVAAADAPLVQYLLRAPGIRLFEFVQAEAYTRRFPFLRAVTLPRGIVDLAADKPPQDVRLVAATASLVVREDLHPALIQLLVQAAQQVHGDAGWFSRAGEFPSPSVSDLPLAPEAARLYRDGVPWLQRYLPFWLANFIDRMWFVLLPLAAVMIPLSRVLPPLVELRVRSRVFRWYAHLRAVEQALERPAPALDRLRAEIERIDGQVERVGMPLSYTHELYELRSHIELVRKRILDRTSVVR